MVLLDVSYCGMGDAVVALWMAEGIRERGDQVEFRKGPHNDLITAFGHKLSDAKEGGIGFGEKAPSYDLEMKTENAKVETRTLQWQSHFPYRVAPKRPTPTISDEAWTWALTIKDRRRSADTPLIVMFPFANYHVRCWPLTKWVRLAWSLHDKKAAVVATHSKEEGLGGFPFFFWNYPTDHMMALMKVADLVVANDSGTAHLAGTLGTKTLAVMGPTDPRIVFGYCPEVQTISTTFDRIECTGCHFKFDHGYRAWCDSGCESLNLLAVKEVETKIWEMIRA